MIFYKALYAKWIYAQWISFSPCLVNTWWTSYVQVGICAQMMMTLTKSLQDFEFAFDQHKLIIKAVWRNIDEFIRKLDPSLVYLYVTYVSHLNCWENSRCFSAFRIQNKKNCNKNLLDRLLWIVEKYTQNSLPILLFLLQKCNVPCKNTW